LIRIPVAADKAADEGHDLLLQGAEPALDDPAALGSPGHRKDLLDPNREERIPDLVTPEVTTVVRVDDVRQAELHRGVEDHTHRHLSGGDLPPEPQCEDSPGTGIDDGGDVHPFLPLHTVDAVIVAVLDDVRDQQLFELLHHSDVLGMLRIQVLELDEAVIHNPALIRLGSTLLQMAPHEQIRAGRARTGHDAVRIRNRISDDLLHETGGKVRLLRPSQVESQARRADERVLPALPKKLIPDQLLDL
jgi:hypothetical protein